MTTLARHLVAGDAHDRLPFRPDCPICAGTHGLAGIDPRTLTGTDAGVAASALRPVAGALSALLVAGALAPAPASAWRGTDTVNGDEGLSTTTNEEDEGSTAEEGSDAEAPAVTTPDTPDEATGAAVEADTPTPPETPVPAPSPAPAPTPSPAPAPAASSTPAPSATPAPAAPANAVPAPAPAPAPTAAASATPAPAPAASTAAAEASGHRAIDARESATDAASASAAAGHAVAQPRTAVTPGGGAPVPAPRAVAAASTPAHVAVAARTAAASSSATSRSTATQRVVARRTPAGRVVVAAGRWHTVRAGETLWSLASGLLPPGATAGQIARQVAQLVALNTDRIDSPDLIRVGQRLRLR